MSMTFAGCTSPSLRKRWNTSPALLGRAGPGQDPVHLIDTFVLLSHINEDKRKTEGQKQIFDVVYEVDGCPVSEFMLFCSDTWV